MDTVPGTGGLEDSRRHITVSQGKSLPFFCSRALWSTTVACCRTCKPLLVGCCVRGGKHSNYSVLTFQWRQKKWEEMQAVVGVLSILTLSLLFNAASAQLPGEL